MKQKAPEPARKKGQTSEGKTKRPELTEVTLVAATSVAVLATIEALHASMRQAQFAETLMLSDKPQRPGIDAGISWRPIGRLNSREDYSRFMLRELADHITTRHALVVQWDGFVIKGSAWHPSFLEYDYIGAPWPHFDGENSVGNGGFSLRSARLLKACQTLPFEANVSEDVAICRVYRHHLEDRGIRFAPEAVARRFSFERTKPTGNEFGFHGSFNLVQLMDPTAALELFRSLEPNVLARSERRELLLWALRRGRVQFALSMLARLA